MKAIVGVLLVIGLVLGGLAILYPLNLWDENAYLANARSHVTSSNYTEDFRFPLLEWVIALFWIFGESLVVAKIVIILFSLLFILFTYLIAIKFYSRRSSLLLTIFICFNWLFLFWGFRVYNDIAATALCLVGIWFYLERRLFFSGLLFGLGFLMKFPSALLVISVLIVLFFRKQIKECFVICFGFLVALIPSLVFDNLVTDFISQYSIISSYTTYQSSFLHLSNFLFVLGPFVLFFFYGLRYSTLEVNVYLLLFFIYYMYFVNLKDTRYFISVLPFFFIVGWKGVVSLVSRNKKWIFVLLLVPIFSVSMLIYHLTSSDSCSSDFTRAIIYVNSQNPDFIVSNAWPWFGYYGNNKVSSVYDDLDVVISFNNADYFVHHTNFGGQYDVSNLVLDKRFGCLLVYKVN